MSTFKPSAEELIDIASRALADIQAPNEGRGLRLHLINSKRSTNGKTVCRLWHPDGAIVGQAGGWGYDRTGAAFANALEALIPQDLEKLDPALPGVGPSLGRGGRVIDGAVGFETVTRNLATIGLEVERYDTSDHSQIVFIRRIR